MAKAPTPGSAGTTGGNEMAASASMKITITVRGESHSLRPNSIPISERAAVRRATGSPLELFLADTEGNAAVGLDTIMVLWWLAKRGTDPLLTLARVEAEWPADLTPDDIDVTIDDGEPEYDDPDRLFQAPP